ncbi:MAG: leucyl aminopeptidase family protein [Bdellovibrionales bacterium]|nr:leucyl aminopeptidase family protein [Bdellovibrionales bacterium]
MGLTAKEGRRAEVFVHLGKSATVPKDWNASFADSDASMNTVIRVADSAEGVKMLVAPRAAIEIETDARLLTSLDTRIRDVVGQAVGQLERLDVKRVHFGFELPSENLPAAILGLEMALYRYKRVLKGEDFKIQISLSHKGKPLTASRLGDGVNMGRAVNLARHLVNLPPNYLNPVSYADFVKQLFGGVKNVSVSIWDEQRLKKENMGLHLAVGQGSKFPPRLVHIRYRGGGAKNPPLAFVGKGITFDTGGLDIKPASGMRLMKKDMGGSAAVLGLASWAVYSGFKGNADFYLALAENAIGDSSFRPSDVITARSGMSVEIHNTDAEGRLVLADALDVAVTNKETPSAVINVATLTGAIKVALGAGLTGLFSNDTKLGAALAAAGQRAGDPSWVMPLMQKYRSTFNTPFADVVNAVDGFGGAITAALFLEKFAKDIPWAHLDIYAWKDSPEGACLESGGSGQAVFTLIEWLKGRG